MFAQLLTNGIIAAGAYLLFGTGFHIITKTASFFNLAYGILITLGAYFSFAFLHYLRFPVWWAIIFGVLLSVSLGCIIERFVFRKLVQIGASGAIKMICSLGIYIVLQNMISLAFGDETKGLNPATVSTGIEIWGIYLTLVQLFIMIIGIMVWLCMLYFLLHTRLGIAMRAVASDSELSEACGLKIDHINFWAAAIGSGIAAIAGVLMACDTGMNPTMGMNALMMALVVVIVGGVEKISGVVLAALFLGIGQHASIYLLNSQWQDAIAFVILLTFLIIKPEGFLGKKIKKATT